MKSNVVRLHVYSKVVRIRQTEYDGGPTVNRQKLIANRTVSNMRPVQQSDDIDLLIIVLFRSTP